MEAKDSPGAGAVPAAPWALKIRLVFVHGFNTKFNEALFRAAQIFWDLQYDGVPVLFSWPSHGGVINYLYDRDSALGARARFRELLGALRNSGVNRVHVLAHSMGNLVALEALVNGFEPTASAPVCELILAAPDLDRDHFCEIAPLVRAGCSGMTLYASSADRALLASKKIAGDIPRAGDVPAAGPVVLQGMDSIDVTAVGAEIFGLGRAPFAKERSLLNDIGLVIGSSLRLPNRRLREIRGVPNGASPAWWRFVT